MNENLGSLAFDIRAMITQFKQDLAEGDREYQKYKAKWEQPINIGGRMSSAGGGGGGGGGAGMPNRGGTAVAGGPSIVGTSNGDVTWRLENAVALHQDRQETTALRFSAQNRAIMNAALAGNPALAGPMASQLGMTPAQLMGALGKGLTPATNQATAQAQVVTQAVQQQAQTGAAAGGATNQAMALSQGFTQVPLGEGTGQATQSVGQAGSSSFLGRSIPIRNMLRYTMAGLVVDVMAGELANESNYHKAVRIAGMDQGAQAQATLQKLRGGFSAIPLVGGLAYNALAADGVNQIEGDLALTQQRVGYQDASGSFMSGTRGMRSAAGIALSSPMGFVRRSMQIRQAAGDRSIANMREADELRKNAYFEPMAQSTGDFSDDDNAVLARHFGKYGSGSTRQQQVDYINSIREGHNKATRDQINNTINGRSVASQQLTTAERTQLGYESDYEVSTARAQTRMMQTQNQFRPVQAQAQFTVDQVRALLSYMNRPAPTNPEDMAAYRAEQSKLRQSAYQSRESLIGQQNEITQDIRFGSARQYNPYTQSVLSFTDRNPETISDQYKAVVAALQDLTSVLKGIKN